MTTSTVEGAICVSDGVGTLTIDGTSLNCPAWGIPDLSALWGLVPPQRGKNVVIPGTPGQLPMPRRDDEAVVTLVMLISGTVDSAGTATADENVGLITNIGLLEAAFVAPTPPAATLPATLTVAALSLAADVQVTGFKVAIVTGGFAKAALELTIPAGRFV
jgi:hypothetical protein